MPARSQTVKFPCASCGTNCGRNAIQCSRCQLWVHRRCVPLTEAQLTEWGEDGLSFLCRGCSFTGPTGGTGRPLYNAKDALDRVSKAECITAAARSERLLLSTYRVQLPERQSPTGPPGARDAAATGVLRFFEPVLLTRRTPLAVVGDGNCLFRALSRGLFGTEDLALADPRQTATSADGNLRIYSAPGGGKKKGQVKRKRAARTRGTANKKVHLDASDSDTE